MNHSANGVKGVWPINHDGDDDGGRAVAGGRPSCSSRHVYPAPPHPPASEATRQDARCLRAARRNERQQGNIAEGIIQEDGPRPPVVEVTFAPRAASARKVKMCRHRLKTRESRLTLL
jgi:hypothetical protein